MKELQKIGFIGLGHMGARQVQELVKSPVPLMIYDVVPAAMAPFEGQADLGEDMAEVGRDADIVGICVQNDKQVRDCAEHIFPTMKQGAVLLVHSTVTPATMVALGNLAAEYGVTVLDAALTRTGQVQDGPFLFCMTGGDPEAAARVQSVLDSFSTKTLHVGPLGSAMALKICNNLASICSVMINLEAVGLAEKAGVPMDKLLTIMKGNGVMTPFADYIVSARNAQTDEIRTTMRNMANISEKDLRLAEALATQSGATAPINAFVSKTLKRTFSEIFAK